MTIQTLPENGIYNGRYSAKIEGDFVVFLIGARLNSLRHFRKMSWVGNAFGEMTNYLLQHPEKGLLHAEGFFRFFPVTSLTVMYWRSFEELENFARDRNDPHLEAWRRFNQEIRDDGSIGIWHETYLVKANNFETIYGNMPRFGLAGAGEHLPAGQHRHTARGRVEDKSYEPPVQVY